MKKYLKILSGFFLMATAMFICLPVTALAQERVFDVSQSGSVLISTEATAGGTQYTVNGTTYDVGDTIVLTGTIEESANGYITITTNNAPAEITLRNLTVKSTTQAALTTEGNKDVVIELDGNNTLEGKNGNPGLYNRRHLTIKDETKGDKAGTLTAIGGEGAAGIGPDSSAGANDGGNVTIKGGTITAKGGDNAAGIGGGMGGEGSFITIEDGDVTAIGGVHAAGIGGGQGGAGRSITITGGKVEAEGGSSAAGIGGGSTVIDPNRKEGYAEKITITGGTVVAKGGANGAGIGGGNQGVAKEIVITGGTITAQGGSDAAGIGGGNQGGGEVSISGGTVTAVGGNGGGAGIGSGRDNDNTYIGTGGLIGLTIDVSGNAVIIAAGGRNETGDVDAAAIGTGVCVESIGEDIYSPGEERGVDLDNLNTTGSITTFPAGTTLAAIKAHPENGTTRRGKKIVQENPGSDTPPVYTERSCIADIDVESLISELLKNAPSATSLDIEFDDNICLNPELMTALFADNRVTKNCFFSYKGCRYVLKIVAVNKNSKAYKDCFDTLAKEPDSLAGFMKMAEIFRPIGVTLHEINEE